MHRVISLVVATLAVMVFAVVRAEGNIEAGKTKSAMCAGCHGPDGNSVVPQWPKIAGQHATYLARQLKEFKSGMRKNREMSPMASPLSEQDMQDLGAYFASQKGTAGSADPGLAETGEQLYQAGNPETGVLACMACHGPGGTGNSASDIPALSGQHAAYTATQMRAYQSGERKGDLAPIMQAIAEKMTEAEIAAVSSYIEGLH